MITDNPLVSVVLPAYKGDFFRQAIGGILQQTYRNFELIIVDDCSPYDFKRDIDKVADSRIRYYRNEKNLGSVDLSYACSHACSYANGKYLMLASDDDVYHPEYIQTMVEMAEAWPETSLFSCRVGHIDEDGALKDPGVPVLPYESPLYFMWMHEVKRRHMTLFEWFMRRDSLVAIGGFARFPLAWFSDTQTMYKLAAYKDGGVRFSPRMLGLYRDSAVQISYSGRGVEQKLSATIGFYKWLLEEIQGGANRFETAMCEDAVLWRALRGGAPVRARQMLCQLVKQAGGVLGAIRMAKIARKSGLVSTKSLVRAVLSRYFPI